MAPMYIMPGRPWENGYVEFFNGTMANELLNRKVFDTIEAKVLLGREYNTKRPHSALGYRPPAPVNGQIAVSASNASTMEGYQIKGTAEYITKGSIVDTFKKLVSDMFNGAITAKGALVIIPEKVIVTTPGADNKKEL